MNEAMLIAAVSPFMGFTVMSMAVMALEDRGFPAAMAVTMLFVSTAATLLAVVATTGQYPFLVIGSTAFGLLSVVMCVWETHIKTWQD